MAARSKALADVAQDRLGRDDAPGRGSCRTLASFSDGPPALRSSSSSSAKSGGVVRRRLRIVDQILLEEKMPFVEYHIRGPGGAQDFRRIGFVAVELVHADAQVFELRCRHAADRHTTPASERLTALATISTRAGRGQPTGVPAASPRANITDVSQSDSSGRRPTPTVESWSGCVGIKGSAALV